MKDVRRIVGGERARRKSARGFSLPEVLVAVALMGMGLAAASYNWQSERLRREVDSASRLARSSIHQARMYSIFRGSTHFVVFDPHERTVSVFADVDGSGAFETSDRSEEPVSVVRWSRSVRLGLPVEGEALPHPLTPGSGSLDAGWDFPPPTAGDGWGPGNYGLVTTNRGMVQSAASPPVTLSSGGVVFASEEEGASAVVLRDRGGATMAFGRHEDRWGEL